MTALITGSAGFIGSHVVDRLQALAHAVRQFDLPAGDDITVPPTERSWLRQALADCEVVFHCAALTNVKSDQGSARDYFEVNLMGTLNVLDAMRVANCKKIVFLSTTAVYGNNITKGVSEDAPRPHQTSLYGASKSAAEGLIEAYCATYQMQAWIFRLVPILGERYVRGHLLDFYRQLQRHPDHLDILGDGQQCKSYLYVQDAIEAMLFGLEKGRQPVNIFNVGHTETSTVTENAHAVCEQMGLLNVAFRYPQQGPTWSGDNLNLVLDCSRIRGLGWRPKTSIPEAVRRTVADFQQRAVRV